MSLLQIEPAIVRDIFARIAWYLGTSRTEVIKKLLITATIWFVAWLAYRIVRRIAKRIVASVDDGDGSTMSSAEKRGHTVAQLVRSVGRVVIVLVAVLVTLAQYVDIGPILAGAGILGLAVSFGAQSLVKDIIAGFFVLVEHQFAVGDVI